MTASSNLDPEDWDGFRRQAHALLDRLITDVATIRERPVWRPAPEATRAFFERALPAEGRALEAILADVDTHIVPYATGNRHPGFMGWVHGAGTPFGVLGELIAASLNLNCGGRDHVGIALERQMARWMADALGYPAEASGLFVTGSSMANLLAVILAKLAVLGTDSRAQGLRQTERQLIAYCSSEAHGCIAQAMELTGLGSTHLRLVATDEAGRMDVGALAAGIAADRALGLQPFLIVATAGTVNSGALDPIHAIAAVAEKEQLWLHVDGAIGAMAALSDRLRPLLDGIAASHSVAMDFHKWGQVPYDAGFLVVRDGVAHKAAFAGANAYLQRAERGLAAGDTWPCDLGPDLSRSCRALKTWLTFEALGTARIAGAIEANCDLATYMAALVADSGVFELKAPVALNIVCFGLRGAGRSALNREIVVAAQMSGEAAPSWTTIKGETVIRCAIVNHRTTRRDVEAVMARLTADAKALAG
jgi:aromatic-L-amino-acid/L-tryptophan decarboxylase